jgi:hypothetical protein
LLGDLSQLFHGVVHGSNDEILKHLYIVGIDNIGLQGYLLDFLLAAEANRNHTASGRALDNGGLDFSL